MGHSDDEYTKRAGNQSVGKVPSFHISITAGKCSVSDFFDDNQNSHDSRTHFLNWSLRSNIARNSPSNT